MNFFLICGMKELFCFFEQFIDSWQSKAAVSVVLVVLGEFLQQFSSTFGADSFLLVLLFILVWFEAILAGITALKTRKKFSQIITGISKIPLYCLYLFLVGAMSVSIEHSIHFGLPILNLFIAYLVASEVFSIIGFLQGLGFNIPPLLLFITTGIRLKVEGAIKTGMGAKEADTSDSTRDETKSSDESKKGG